MKRITVTDMTLVSNSASLSFREKIETARQLDNLQVDVIDLPEIVNPTADALLIRTVSAFVKNSAVSVGTGMTAAGISAAASAAAGAKKARLRINIPVSAVQMEYFCHKKAPKLLEEASALFAEAVATGIETEFCAGDATRADRKFLTDIISAAANAGVGVITLCDDEGAMLPDEFASFISGLRDSIPSLSGLKLGVLCRSENGMAVSSALMAVKAGADEIKCCACGDDMPRVDLLAGVISHSGERIGISAGLNFTTLRRTVKQIEWITSPSDGSQRAVGFSGSADAAVTVLDVNDTAETVTAAVRALGYDLSDDDYAKIYEEFRRIAGDRTVGSKELEAVVASVALQVPPTYKLISYVINNGNIISASAQIKLEKDGRELTGISLGDGPVDASFRALEQMIGHHFELDDFQIQSVTEGREAMGSALVRLRHDGKLYSGNGISTDIIGSSIRAYINAVNKIVYEEI